MGNHDPQEKHLLTPFPQPDGWPANLCITHLSDPSTTTSTLIQRRLLSVPTEPWEQVPPGRFPNLATNEGPVSHTIEETIPSKPMSRSHIVFYAA